MSVCTLDRSRRLVDDPVAFYLSIRSEGSSPGHIDTPTCHLREGQVAWLAGSCRHMRDDDKVSGNLKYFHVMLISWF